jgi:hypothetical protein
MDDKVDTGIARDPVIILPAGPGADLNGQSVDAAEVSIMVRNLHPKKYCGRSAIRLGAARSQCQCVGTPNELADASIGACAAFGNAGIAAFVSYSPTQMALEDGRDENEGRNRSSGMRAPGS